MSTCMSSSSLISFLICHPLSSAIGIQAVINFLPKHIKYTLVLGSVHKLRQGDKIFGKIYPVYLATPPKKMAYDFFIPP